MATFSVIVPVYNAELYLRQALDSILYQSYPDFEVIMVDDGSTDGSGQICDEYAEKDQRFRVIHQINGGVTRARKTGIRNARYEYVTWVDADDYIGLETLNGLNKIINKYAPDMVAFGNTMIEQDGTTEEHGCALESDKIYSTNQQGFYDHLIYDRRMINSENEIRFELWGKAFKRSILKDCMLAVPDSIRIGEDMAAVFPAICRCNTIYVSSMHSYFYRKTPGSIMRTFKTDELQRYRVLIDYLSRNKGKIPQENIDLYAYQQILQYVMTAAVFFDSYSSYSKNLGREISPELSAIVNKVEVPKQPVKKYLKFLLLKYRFYWVFWVILRTKRRLHSTHGNTELK